MIVGYVRHILERGAYLPTPSANTPKNAHRKRVNEATFREILF